MREFYREAKELERIIKGVSHHRRMEILFSLFEKPNLTLTALSEKVDSDIRNTSQHVFKMVGAGLVRKRVYGYTTEHSLTSLGKKVASTLRHFKK